MLKNLVLLAFIAISFSSCYADKGPRNRVHSHHDNARSRDFSGARALRMTQALSGSTSSSDSSAASQASSSQRSSSSGKATASASNGKSQAKRRPASERRIFSRGAYLCLMS